ncbi:hypothetical protein [Paenibacillus rigui]|uniref:Uncharacterized protein n=1 Tax=Paenibacillus rigui TaxID=554312 RepID=A0A229UJ30_9BACL|nr:hypothetical protein [Paenibacillus rigui]OXM83390.1 hypothetical protein CF651_26195 [Paenibacillus rigui]
MKHIHPISEEQCREHYGKPVLVILRDGSELVGVLSRYDQDKIILNGEPSAQAAHKSNRSSLSSITHGKKRKKSSVAKKKNIVVSAYNEGAPLGENPYTPYAYGAPIVLDLALIALLFVLI